MLTLISCFIRITPGHAWMDQCLYMLFQMTGSSSNERDSFYCHTSQKTYLTIWTKTNSFQESYVHRSCQTQTTAELIFMCFSFSLKFLVFQLKLHMPDVCIRPSVSTQVFQLFLNKKLEEKNLLCPRKNTFRMMQHFHAHTYYTKHNNACSNPLQSFFYS